MSILIENEGDYEFGQVMSFADRVKEAAIADRDRQWSQWIEEERARWQGWRTDDPTDLVNASAMSESVLSVLDRLAARVKETAKT